jgi:drug/metabolite transporter (DMT)-like permease
MIAGIGWAIAANLLWALVFLAPLLLPAFSPLELAAGRNLAYGLVSLLTVATYLNLLRGLRPRDWLVAALLTVAGNIGYYLLLVWAIRLAGSAMPTLIIGLLPVTLALAGNALERGLPVRKLLPGAVLIVAGLLLVNGAESSARGEAYALGLGLAAIAHLFWLAYGLGNARFLKSRAISPDAWTSAVGIATLPLAALLWLAEPHEAMAARDWSAFIAVSAAFGVLSSWLATAFWNRASAALPTALASQLIVFETVGALVYAWVWNAAMPALPVLGGAALLVLGVLVSVRAYLPRAT